MTPEPQPTIGDIAKAAAPKHKGGVQHQITNFWIRELNQFAGKQIEVTDISGKVFSGRCIAINSLHMSVLLECETEIVAIKNIALIRRPRSAKNSSALSNPSTALPSDGPNNQA